MAIAMKTLANDVQAMIRGQMLGNVFYVNGDKGDDHSSGADWRHAIRTLAMGVTKLVDESHDYLLMAGADTPGAAVEIAVADAHIIGVGLGSPAVRGFTLTGPAADCLQPTAAADNLEIANIDFVTAAAQVVVDDAGAIGLFIHDCTFKPVGETDNSAITLDLEGIAPAIVNCDFLWQKLAVNSVGLRSLISKCLFVSDDTSAVGVEISNATGKTSQILDCLFQLNGGSTDTGIKLISGANDGIIARCLFTAAVNDAIDVNSATGTLIVECYQLGITGTSTSSLNLAVN